MIESVAHSRRELSDHVAEWLQVLVLSAVGVFGLIASIVQFALRDSEWLENNPAIGLSVLSFIAIHLAVDRTVHARRRKELAERLERLELRAEAREAAYVDYLKATGHYIRVQAIRRYLAAKGYDGFPKLATDLLREPFTLLESLAEGRLDIPEPQIPAVQSSLGLLFKKSFEAVSDDDLDFWLDTKGAVAAGYFEQNITAIRRGTAVSRIFITSLRVMDKRLPDIATVLKRQQDAGVAWGLCLKDDFDPDVKNKYDAQTDFALFDGNEVVTYFDVRSMRRFNAVFNTHGERISSGNDQQFAVQRQMHTMLLGECWIVNARFANWYTDPKLVAQHVIDALNERALRHNDLLRRSFPNLSTPDRSPFLFVVNANSEIEAKLKDMHQLAKKFRHSGDASNPTLSPENGA